ncbi:uncharacterized protein PAC_03460 [Phialocephala subalpina]|uniref:Integral membrane protein n=1 Tax=Phialocephala subalpina TaxID=576137 RepID=A0A1L7WLE3_9HELO|nr:uncharacterized protein PAC_03460 [Phialocephala subalpina]
MAFERVKTILLADKTAPIVTTVTATVAFVLSLIALLSTSERGGLLQYDVVMLNTSTLFQNAIKVETSGSSVTARAIQAARTPAPTPGPSPVEALEILEARQLSLPGVSQVSSFFASVGSELSSAISPQSTGTSGSTNSSGLLGDLESFFNSLVGTVTGAAGEELVTVVNSIVKDVTDSLGIKDWYGIYMTGFCDGDYTSSGGYNTSSCTSYNDLHINSTNSTVKLGTTTLDFSAINIPAKLSKSGGQLKVILNVIIALQIIGIVSCGILILLAPLIIILSFFNRWIFRLAIGMLSALAAACFALIAGFGTGIQVAVSSVINGVGDGLGVEAYSGGSFIAMTWISYFFMMSSAVLWFTRWHGHRYVRRGNDLGVMQRPLVKTAESKFNARI